MTNPSEDHWSHVRHDFRTPINQIIGYGEMLEEDAAAAGQDEAVSDLRKIQQAARRMLELINVHLNPSAPGMAKPPGGASAAGAAGAAGRRRLRGRGSHAGRGRTDRRPRWRSARRRRRPCGRSRW